GGVVLARKYTVRGGEGAFIAHPPATPCRSTAVSKSKRRHAVGHRQIGQGEFDACVDKEHSVQLVPVKRDQPAAVNDGVGGNGFLMHHDRDRGGAAVESYLPAPPPHRIHRHFLSNRPRSVALYR